MRLAYETWGRLAPDASNAVLVLHALTGDSHVTGPVEPGHPTPGWWDGLVGPGLPLDTDRWFIVAPNVLGGCQGSTGPSSRRPDGTTWGGSFPYLTQRDMVAAEAQLADALGIDRWALVTGGSMGGMRAVEWAVSYPERTGSLLLLATTAAASAEQIAWAGAQLHAIRSDPGWRGGDYYDAPPGTARTPGWASPAGSRTSPTAASRSSRPASAAARRTARTRSGPGATRWSPTRPPRRQADGTFRRGQLRGAHRVDERPRRRPGPGGTAAALRRVTARRWWPGSTRPALPAVPAGGAGGRIPGADRLRVIESPSGHDGFLTEIEQVGGLVRELLGS